MTRIGSSPENHWECLFSSKRIEVPSFENLQKEKKEMFIDVSIATKHSNLRSFMFSKQS